MVVRASGTGLLQLYLYRMQPNERTIPKGRSLKELTTPHGDFMPSVETLDGELQQIQASLNPLVPQKIRERIATTRNITVYGGFSYDLFAVSVYWSLTCIEMAVWSKSQEEDPTKHDHKATLRPLLDWAQKAQLLPEHLSYPTFPRLISSVRNALAHPKGFNTVVMPIAASEAITMMIEIVNSLWPLKRVQSTAGNSTPPATN